MYKETSPEKTRAIEEALTADWPAKNSEFYNPLPIASAGAESHCGCTERTQLCKRNCRCRAYLNQTDCNTIVLESFPVAALIFFAYIRSHCYYDDERDPFTS
jgi:hypothetical protein